MAEAISQQVLSSLIGSIYDCALDPSLWEQALTDIGIAFNGQISMLGLADLRRDRLLLHRTVGAGPSWLDLLAKHAPEEHRMLDAFAAHLSLDDPKVLSLHVPVEYQATSPFFQEFLGSQGIVDFMQCNLMETSTHFSAFGVGRNEAQGIITTREIGLGGLLLQHLRRAVTISKVLDVRTIERARLAEALDAFRCGVVLTDERSFILHANRAAEQMLRSGNLIGDAHGLLQANASSAAKELRSAIILAAQDEARIGTTGLAIRLTDLGAPPIFAHVLPMTSGDLRARLHPESVAAVFITTSPEEDEWAHVVATAYSLTRAETRVLGSLLAGRTLAETANDLGVAATTARTHLDSIFLKTGVSRQVELIRVAMQVASPAGSPAQ